MSIFLSGLREASKIVLCIEEIGAVLKKDERKSRHFYGFIMNRIAGNQTGVSIFFKSVIISLFHRVNFHNRGCGKDILRLFCLQKGVSVCL